MAELVLKAGREKPLLAHHPWIFSGAVGSIRGSPGIGETLAVLDSGGDFIGWAGYSPESQIRARIWSRDPAEEINPEFFHNKIQTAINLRNQLNLGTTNAYRLIHGESDGLPGLIVDRYNETLVVQFLFAGVELWRKDLIAFLGNTPGIVGGFERSDSRVRELEGLHPQTGKLFGEVPEVDQLVIEHGVNYHVNIAEGQKTGFYLDQRETRRVVRLLSEGRKVLDCYCYTGSMAINAHLGGAQTISAVDTSEIALTTGNTNLTANRIAADHVQWIQGDVPSVLRKFRDLARRFDMIILDPPNFAPTNAHANKAARAYKDINLLAFKLLQPEGILITCSCSGGISAEFFQKIVASAAVDAGVEAQILQWLRQGEDHPVRLGFPEGSYLKGLVCRVG